MNNEEERTGGLLAIVTLFFGVLKSEPGLSGSCLNERAEEDDEPGELEELEELEEAWASGVLGNARDGLKPGG